MNVPRPRRVYRAVAHYPDQVITRHFLTKRARDSWAEHRRLGYEAGDSLLDDRPAIPPALKVETADSHPVSFPGDTPDWE